MALFSEWRHWWRGSVSCASECRCLWRHLPTYLATSRPFSHPLLSPLLVDGKTFANATIADLRVGEEYARDTLYRHPGLTIEASRIHCFWTKGHTIPAEFLNYFPVYFGDPHSLSKKRKELADSAAKVVKKYSKKDAPASVVGTQSIARFFTSPANQGHMLPKKIITSKQLAWHDLLDSGERGVVCASEGEGEDEGEGEGVDVFAGEGEGEGVCASEGEGSGAYEDDGAGASEGEGTGSALIPLSFPSISFPPPHSLPPCHLSPSPSLPTTLSGVGEGESEGADTGEVMGMGEGVVVVKYEGVVVVDEAGVGEVKIDLVDSDDDGANKPVPVDVKWPVGATGKTHCLLCGKKNSSCSKKFTGKICSSSWQSSGKVEFLYGPSWRKNSCAMNAVSSAIQMGVLNLNEEGINLVRGRMPGMCSILVGLNEGTIDNWKASGAIEEALHDVIWNPTLKMYYNVLHRKFVGEFSEIRGHIFVCALQALGAFQGIEVPNTNHPGELFKVKYSRVSRCLCGNEERVQNMTRDCVFFDRLQQMVDTNENLSSALSDAPETIRCSCERHWDSTEFYDIGGPLFLFAFVNAVHHESHTVIVNSKSGVQCDQTVVPSEIVFGTTAYTLVATGFLGGYHFNCLGRHLVESKYYHHDGMLSNARWVAKDTNQSFPLNLNDMLVDHAMYMPTKYLKLV